MKSKYKTIALITIAAIAPLFFTGCLTDEAGAKQAPGIAASAGGVVSKVGTAIDNLLLVPNSVIEQVTNIVPIARTEHVFSLQSFPDTNGAVVMRTNVVTQTNVVNETVIQTVTNTVWVPRPEIQSGIAMVKGASPLIPQPYGAATDAGLVALSGLLALYAQRKNAASKAASADADSAAELAAKNFQMLQAAIKGIENVAGEIPGGEKVKQSVQKYATAAGVQEDLHRVVQSSVLS